MFEAGTKYLSAFSSYSISPVSASTISTPHSPLLAGSDASKASARSPNFRVATEKRGFLPFATAATADFDCAGCAPGRALAKHSPYEKSTAAANPTRTVHLWQ